MKKVLGHREHDGIVYTAILGLDGYVWTIKGQYRDALGYVIGPQIVGYLCNYTSWPVFSHSYVLVEDDKDESC